MIRLPALPLSCAARCGCCENEPATHVLTITRGPGDRHRLKYIGPRCIAELASVAREADERIAAA